MAKKSGPRRPRSPPAASATSTAAMTTSYASSPAATADENGPLPARASTPGLRSRQGTSAMANAERSSSDLALDLDASSSPTSEDMSMSSLVPHDGPRQQQQHQAKRTSTGSGPLFVHTVSSGASVAPAQSSSSTMHLMSPTSAASAEADRTDKPAGVATRIHSYFMSSTLPVYRLHQIPEYLRDNEYIWTGYRAGYDYAMSWRSILFVHNETGNIWTHLLGLILFLVLVGMITLGNGVSGWGLVTQTASTADRVVMAGFLLSACACFLFSTCFHTHFCNNRHAYILFGCLDYAGISILICGSSVIVTYYAYYCHTFWRIFYLTSLLSVSFVGIVGPMFPVWPTARFRVWRTLIYIGSGVLSGLPIVHYLAMHGVPSSAPWWAVYGWFVMGGTYIGGAVIYATKVPERWIPGAFDRWGHSHQWWHLCVVAAALVHFHAARELMAWRIGLTCPAES
ncbi:hemolysin-III related-domain-containing protein [Blastocladiella britannica]|nr:hemolysin-III related-domain-containing protein [Blastocladiella britannica]